MPKFVIRLLCLGIVLTLPGLVLADPDFNADWTVYGTVGDGWGDAAATAGDVNGDGYSDVLIGAPYWTGGQQSEGIVYLFYGSETGVNVEPEWAYASNVNFAQFGYAVAPAGDTNGDGYDDFLVGAPGVSAGHTEEGRVYLFAGGPGDPTLLAAFEMNEEEARFGHTVAWAGDVNGDGYDDILAGAPEWGGFGSPFYVPVQGAARLYHGGPGGPDQTPDWSLSGGQTDADFGYSVAGVGDVNGDGYTDIMVGQPLYDPGIIDTDHGAAHLYLGSASGLSSSPDWTLYGEGSGDEMGMEVAYAGDVNGDGHADALVGAPEYTVGQGAFYVCEGHPGGLTFTERHLMGNNAGTTLSTLGDYNGDGIADLAAGGGPDDSAWVFWGSQFGLAFGEIVSGSGFFAETVAGVGDVNGDGFGDLLITDPLALNGAGSAQIYHGGQEFDSTPASMRELEGDLMGGLLGRSVQEAGDVDGDGDDELLVGVSGGGALGGGQVQLFLGLDAGIAPDPDLTIDGQDPDGRFGEAVASAGDVNGDGYADVVIGEPGADRVHVHHGGPGGLAATAAWSFTFPETGSDYGAAVAGGGDVNGDGYADIVVGAPLRADGGSDRGLVHFFLGSPTGITGALFSNVFSSQDGSLLGAAVAIMGDANGDGFDDVVIGVPGYTVGSLENRGGVFVYYGGATGLDFEFEFLGVGSGNALGTSVAGAGDVNGDGLADFVAGEPYHDYIAADTGRAVLFLGSSDVPFQINYPLSSVTNFGGERYGLSVDGVGDLDGRGNSSFVVGSIVWDTNGSRADIHRMRDGNIELIAVIIHGEDGTDSVAAGVGDIDGDGLPEVAVGSPRGRNEYGSVWLHGPVADQSTSFPAASPRVQQVGGDPIALRGLVPEAADLRFTMEGWLPTGRAPYRLEWQLAAGQDAYPPIAGGDWAIGDGSLTAGVPVDADPAVVLEGSTRHRWRVRVASTNPYLPHGRWLTDQPNTSTLYAFRVVDTATAVDDTGDLPLVGSPLAAPYPNPFNPSTTFEFRLRQAGEARLRVFDVSGRLVRTLVSGVMDAGTHSVRWNGRDEGGRNLASGNYHAVLEVDGARFNRKLTLLK